MALHTKWSSGHLIFHDGTNDILEIKNGTDGVEFHQAVTYPDPNTATGNMTTTGSLAATDNRIQFLNSTTARNLYLAQASGCAGIEFKIFTGDGTGAITIKEAVSSSTVVTLGANEGAIVISDGADWRGMVGGNS